MIWEPSTRADPASVAIADRHYNRQKVGTPQFVPPGRCLVLRAGGGALWVTSWPFAEFVRHDWPGAWVNSLFRRECPDLPRASDMIREAVAITRGHWPDTPALGMVTFIDAAKTRHKRDRPTLFTESSPVQAGGVQRPGAAADGPVRVDASPPGVPGPDHRTEGA